MADDLRLGLIGAGRWGRNYTKTINAMGGVRLARLASGNPASRTLVGDDCQISEDWQTLMAAGDLDGIIIATPPALHGDMATGAITAGIPVLIEKPLTLDVAEAEALLALARKQKAAIALVDHIHLYHPAYVELKRQGLGMGHLQGLRSAAGNWGPFRKDASVLWDWACHDVALCLDLVGADPDSVLARRTEVRDTDEGLGETLAIKLNFPDGIVADIDVSNLMDGKKRFLAAHYDHETLIYDDHSETPLVREPRPTGACDPAHATAIDVPSGRPLDRVLQAFVHAIRLGEQDLGGLGLGVRVVRTLAACDAALRDAGKLLNSGP